MGMAEPGPGRPTAPAPLVRQKGGPIRIGLIAVSLLYPFIAMLSIRWIGPGALIGLLCMLLVARSFLNLKSEASHLITWALMAVAITMLVIGLIDGALAIRLYPVLMSLAMLAAFASTLIRPPSMIERFARIRRPDLPAHAIAYTRKATIAWCMFFIANAAVSLATTLSGNWTIWTFYNGFLSYVAMGAFALGEWLVRIRTRRKAGGH